MRTAGVPGHDGGSARVLLGSARDRPWRPPASAGCLQALARADVLLPASTARPPLLIVLMAGVAHGEPGYFADPLPACSGCSPA